MNKQNSQENILGYNPDLGIYSRPSSYDKNYYEENFKEDIFNPNKSTSLQEFEEHLPSSKVQKIIGLKSQLQIFKEEAREKLGGHDLSDKYFAASNVEEKKEIALVNKEDVELGNTSLETYIEFEKLEEELSDLLEAFLLFVYGKDVDEDDSSEIDAALVKVLNSYEVNNEFEKVNYFSLYYDTQINFIVGEIADGLMEVAGDLSTIEDTANGAILNESSVALLTDSFRKADDLLNRDLFKDSTAIKDIIVSLKNMFLIKQKSDLYLETFSSLFTMGSGIETFVDIKMENTFELEDKLDNFVKTSMYISISKGDIANTLRKKSDFRSFFAKN